MKKTITLLALLISFCGFSQEKSTAVTSEEPAKINLSKPSNQSLLMRIVLGGQDDIIKAKDNLAFWYKIVALKQIIRL